jgi:hypothetical protein
MKAVSSATNAIKMEITRDIKLSFEKALRAAVTAEIHRHGNLQDFVKTTLVKQ